MNGGLRLAADACDGDAIAAAVTQKATAVSFRFSAMSTARVPGDVTGDGVVDVQDLLAVLTAWGPCPGCAEDIDGDGSVGVSDLLVVLAEWDG